MGTVEMYAEIYRIFTMSIVCLCVAAVIVVIFALMLKRYTDKIVAKYDAEYAKQRENHKNSLKILSETTTNDNGCNIDKVFDDLEKNNIDMSCNTKID